MKKKDLTSLKNKTIPELVTAAGDLATQITKAQMDLAMRKIKNVNAVKSLKKFLAQALSIKREKELAAVTNH